MPSIEITAKTLEEAQRNAAAKLGVELDQVKVTVLEETKGLFGKSNLRVLAETIEAKPAKAAKKPAESKAKAEKPEAAPEPEAKPAKKPARGKKADAEVAVADEPKAEAVVEAAPAKPARGRGRAKAEEAPKDSGDGDAEPEVEATAEDGDRLKALVEELLGSSGLEITAKVTSVAGRYVNLSLDGKDSSYIVGKHGEVLNALQYLTNIIGNRRYNNGIRATIECNDYRKRREDALTALAQKIAAEVLNRGEEAVLDALPAFERRVVHRALQEIEGVTTYSEGEEPNRRVVIAPAE